jgi:MuDR family transposase
VLCLNNALFPDVNAFRNSLRHFAIKNEFEVSTVKSDKKRFIGKCKHSDCPCRIRASILQAPIRGNLLMNGIVSLFFLLQVLIFILFFVLVEREELDQAHEESTGMALI